jgi:hypothetical protein
VYIHLALLQIFNQVLYFIDLVLLKRLHEIFMRIVRRQHFVQEHVDRVLPAETQLLTLVLLFFPLFFLLFVLLFVAVALTLVLFSAPFHIRRRHVRWCRILLLPKPSGCV